MVWQLRKTHRHNRSGTRVNVTSAWPKSINKDLSALHWRQYYAIDFICSCNEWWLYPKHPKLCQYNRIWSWTLKNHSKMSLKYVNVSYRLIYFFWSIYILIWGFSLNIIYSRSVNKLYYKSWDSLRNTIFHWLWWYFTKFRLM